MNNAETSAFEWRPKIPCEHERLAGPTPHGGSFARNLPPFCCSLSSQRWPLEHFGIPEYWGGRWGVPAEHWGQELRSLQEPPSIRLNTRQKSVRNENSKLNSFKLISSSILGSD